MRRIVTVLTVAILALSAAAGGAIAQSPQLVRVATLKLVGGAPIFWGIHQGYFTKEGLNVQPVYFEAAAPVATAVATGDTEVGATGITGTLFNLSAGGAKIWLVADRGQEYAGYHLNAMVVTKTEYAAGVHSLADLKGKRIGITTLGSSFHYQLGALLERAHLTLNDVQVVPLRDFNLVVEALRTGQIDGAILSPPVWGGLGAGRLGQGPVLGRRPAPQPGDRRLLRREDARQPGPRRPLHDRVHPRDPRLLRRVPRQAGPRLLRRDRRGHRGASSSRPPPRCATRCRTSTATAGSTRWICSGRRPGTSRTG